MQNDRENEGVNNTVVFVAFVPNVCVCLASFFLCVALCEVEGGRRFVGKMCVCLECMCMTVRLIRKEKDRSKRGRKGGRNALPLCRPFAREDIHAFYFVFSSVFFTFREE